MQFCTSCGKEAVPGKKFCEYCGAPLELPADSPPVPAAPSPVTAGIPVQPPAVPAAGGSGKIRIIAGVFVLIIVIAGIWFVGLPMMGGSTGSKSLPAKTTAAPVQPLTPDTTAVILLTPGPVVPAHTPAASLTYEEKYTQMYKLVYSTNHEFIGGQRESVPVDASAPPLFIKFNITPEIEVGEKVDEVGHMVSTSYVSPTSWFKVSVYDAMNGALVVEEGFGSAKGFSVTTPQDFMVRAPGTYRVEISGNHVIAEVQILTGKS
jgi:hypothetical protein